MSLSLFERMLRDGCKYQHYAEIEGIPHGWSEIRGVLAEPRRVVVMRDDWEADFGSWVNVGGDQQDWQRYTGDSPTASTGPTAAHSFAYYALAETTGATAGDAYHLESAVVDLTSDLLVDAEFAVWVHMYGATMGTLSVQLEDQAATGSWTTLWTRTGQWQTAGGDAFNQVSVSLQSYLGRSVKLRIRYVRGSGDTGDAAVDLPTVTVWTLEPEVPEGVDSVVAALLLSDSQVTSQESDREGGVARGDAFDVHLSWVGLEAAELVQPLFTTPTIRARLAADFDSSADTTITIDDNSDFPITGSNYTERVYLGRECFSYDAAEDGINLNGVIHIGPLQNWRRYQASSSMSFAFVTDKPEVWIGRHVRVYRVLLGPDDRMLGGWKDPETSRVIWHGTVDEDPDDTDLGKILRCLPLVRLPTTEVGYDVGCQVLVPDTTDALAVGSFPIVPTDGAKIRIRGTYSGAGSGSFDAQAPTTMAANVAVTIEDWCREVEGDLDAAFTGAAWYDGIEVGAVATPYRRALEPGQIVIRLFYASGYSASAYLDVPIDPGLYFLTPCVGRQGVRDFDGTHVAWETEVPRVLLSYVVGAWLPVFQTEGAGFLDLEIPSSGLGVVEADSATELIRWDDLVAGPSPMQHVKLLRLAERRLNGTGPVDLSLPNATLKLVAGTTGTVGNVALTLLESSGIAGLNGDQDTLSSGLGYGITARLIDLDAFGHIDVQEVQISAVAAGKASLQSLLGGWLALIGKCLVQRRPAVNKRILAYYDSPGDVGDYAQVSDWIAETLFDGSGVGVVALSFWVRADIGADSYDEVTLFEASDDGSPTLRMFYDSGELDAVLLNDAGTLEAEYMLTESTDGEWHHVFITSRSDAPTFGTQGIQLWYDGVCLDDGDDATGASFATAASQFRLFARHNGTMRLRGQIANFAAFDELPASTTIADLTAAGVRHNPRYSTGTWIGRLPAVQWVDRDIDGVVPNTGWVGSAANLVLSGNVRAVAWDLEEADYVLTLVDTEPSAVAVGVHVPLERHYVELHGVGRPSAIKASNQVLIDRSGIGAKVPKLRVGDLPAINASRPRSVEFKAPGLPEALGIQLASARLALGRGQRHQDISVALWTPMQIGDPVDLRTAHPTTVSPTTGARGVGSLGAIVVGDREVPFTGRRRLQLRLVGLAPERRSWAPCFIVVATNGDQISFSHGDAVRLGTYLGFDLADIGDWAPTFRLFNPGAEATEETELQFSTLVDNRTIEADTALPGWVAAGTVLTWPTTTDALDAMKGAWMFQGVPFKLGGG